MLLILDEAVDLVQQAGKALDLVDHHPGAPPPSLQQQLRFALLGSSARKLKTAGTNLLAGRALWRTMFPLVPEELGGDFDLRRVLRHGRSRELVTREGIEVWPVRRFLEALESDELWP